MPNDTRSGLKISAAEGHGLKNPTNHISAFADDVVLLEGVQFDFPKPDTLFSPTDPPDPVHENNKQDRLQVASLEESNTHRKKIAQPRMPRMWTSLCLWLYRDRIVPKSNSGTPYSLSTPTESHRKHG